MMLPGNELNSGCIFPGLTDDVGLLCLARISCAIRGPLKAVCKSWHKAISSEDLHKVRALEGIQEELLCLQFQQQEDSDMPSKGLVFRLRDPHSGKSTTLPTLPFARLCKELAGGNQSEDPIAFLDYEVLATGSRLLILGGTLVWKDKWKQDSPQVWAFDAAKYEWQQLPNMSRPRKRFAAAAIAREEVLMTASFMETSVEILDLTSGKRRQVAEMPARSFYRPAALHKDGLVYVIPQSPSVGGPRQAFLYNLKFDMWRVAPGFWPAEGSLNTCHAMAVSDGHLYGICAEPDVLGSPAALFRRNPRSKSWECITPLRNTPEVNVADSSHHYMVALGGKLYIFENSICAAAENRPCSYMQVLDVPSNVPEGKESIGQAAFSGVQKWTLSGELVCGVYVLTI